MPHVFINNKLVEADKAFVSYEDRGFRFPLPAGNALNVWEALQMAGGPSTTGIPMSVSLTRPATDDHSLQRWSITLGANDRLPANAPFVQPGDIVARVAGKTRALLTAERVALNFLGHLSGVATFTRAYADAIAHTSARICCTRKTTPGLRALAAISGIGEKKPERFGEDILALMRAH